MTSPEPSSGSEDQQNDDMSPDERVAWLRERGVLITTPEERRAGRIATALRGDLDTSIPGDSDLSYILIPADKSQPLQQFTIANADNGRGGGRGNASGDLLLEHLHTVMALSAAHSKPVDIGLLQRQDPTTATTTLLGSGLFGDQQGDETAPTTLSPSPLNVSEDALRRVAAEVSVEVFTLVHPTPSNRYTGVNIYLDEAGMLKRLPINARASKYAERAGYSPPPTFYGDVYLGRVRIVGNDINRSTRRRENASMLLGPDTALDAPWLQTAATDNLEYQMEMNRITGRGHELQPAVHGSDGKSKQEEGYTWTQTEEELEVIVAIPSSCKKDVQVKFRPQTLEVLHLKQTVMSVRLFERIEVDSGTWTLDQKGETINVVITMEKVEQAMWPRICD